MSQIMKLKVQIMRVRIKKYKNSGVLILSSYCHQVHFNLHTTSTRRTGGQYWEVL